MKKDKIVLCVGMLCMILTIVIGLSYAYWTITKVQEDRNVIASSCLKLDLISNSDSIVNENSFPMTDEDGLKSNPYSFTIQNTCDLNTKYYVILDIENTPNLNLNNYKVYLNSNPIDIEPTIIGTLQDEGTLNDNKHHKVLFSGVINSNEEITFDLRLWIASHVGLEYQNVSLNSKIRVVGEPYLSCKMQVNDSNPGAFNGEGTEDNPYLIESIEDLTYLSLKTNMGELASNVYYELTTDLDFECPSSYVNSKTTVFGDINGNGEVEPLINELTSGMGWLSIGNSKNYFSSNFNGRNHTISNLNAKRQYIGLFGEIRPFTSDPKELEIKNLKIGVKKTNTSYGGALAGYVYSLAYQPRIKITNIETFGDLENVSGSYIGGIIGEAGGLIISKCVNRINMNVMGQYVGGLFGKLDLHEVNSKTPVIQDVYNYGNITGSGNIVGGIVGKTSNTCILMNAYNYGNLNINGVNSLGGLIGYHNDSNAYNCYNYGNIEGFGATLHIGGVFGYHDGGYRNEGFLYNVGNAGSYVKSNVSASAIGGVVGYENVSDVSNVYNYADVIVETLSESSSPSQQYIGGIFGYGYLSNSKKNTNIYNSGNINVKGNYNMRIGGITGFGTNFSNVINTGNIKVSSSYCSAESTKGYCSLSGFIGSSSYVDSSNLYLKSSIDATLNTYGYVSSLSNNDSNVYLNLNVSENTLLEANFYGSKSNNITLENAFYKITGKTGYTINEGSQEYDFSQVNGMWFRDTLKLGNGWKYQDGNYPLLYKVDLNGNPTNELMEGQKNNTLE